MGDTYKERKRERRERKREKNMLPPICWFTSQMSAIDSMDHTETQTRSPTWVAETYLPKPSPAFPQGMH